MHIDTFASDECVLSPTIPMLTLPARCAFRVPIRAGIHAVQIYSITRSEVQRSRPLTLAVHQLGVVLCKEPTPARDEFGVMQALLR